MRVELRLPGWGDIGVEGAWQLTDADGRFRFPGRSAADRRLRVVPEGEWVAPEPLEVPATESRDFRFVLRRGVRIGGLTTDADGAPARAVLTITWQRPTPGRLPLLESGADGRFVVAVPEEVGGVAVRAEAWGLRALAFRSRGGPVAVVRDVEPGREDLRLRMTDDTAVSGTVLGPAGQTMTSGWVLLVPEQGVDTASARVVDGRFRLTDLPEGECRVIAVPEDEAFSPSEVANVHAPADGVTLRVPRSVVLPLEVADGAGATWYATWEGIDASGRPFWRSAGSHAPGILRLRLPPAGAGTLYVRNTTDDRYALLPAVSADAPPPGPIATTTGTSLRGRVAGLQAGEAKGAILHLRGAGIVTSRWLAPDATFHVRGLPAGRYEAEVEVPAPAWLTWLAAEPLPVVEAGSEDVVLTTGIRRGRR